jgi:hypothetical protein
MQWTPLLLPGDEPMFVVGQTYTREEINAMLGVSATCECRIVEYGHVCP